jgi:hypothetical protein
MVEVNISVKAENDIDLPNLLNHIMREIIDTEYRLSEMNSKRRVDLNWVYLDEGKYQWAKNYHN